MADGPLANEVGGTALLGAPEVRRAWGRITGSTLSDEWQAVPVDSYRERLTVPASWWVVALIFGASCGWIMVVATTPALGVVAAIVGAILAAALIWSYGSLTVRADANGLKVGNAHLDTKYIGTVTTLDRLAFRTSLGPDADARAWLRTRPYVDGGVRVEVNDPRDPAPYWLVSCRRPDAVAAALGRAVHETGDQTETEQRRDDGG